MADLTNTAELLWQAIIKIDTERARQILLDHVASSHDHIIELCQKEVNRIVFGKNGEIRDRLSCFHLAAKKGLDVVLTEMIYIARNLDVNIMTSELGWTALHYATYGGHKRAIKVLLKADANKNLMGKNGRCPIHLALTRGHHKIAGYLIAHDCDPNVQDHQGNTPLHYCLQTKSLALTGWTETQRSEMMELLLMKGAIGSIRNSVGDSALHWAVQHNIGPSTVQMLIEVMEFVSDGVNILNSNKQSPLHLANNPGVAEILLSYGALVNQVSADGQSPLHTQVSNPELVEFLLRNNADRCLKDKLGRTALHLAIKCRVPNLRSIHLLSVGSSATINTQDNSYETPLHYACANSYHCFEGMDIQNKSSFKTFQVKAGDDPVIKLLLKNGADVNVMNSKRQTPLLKALELCNYDKATVLYLSSKDRYVDSPDQYGRSMETLAPKWWSQVQRKQCKSVESILEAVEEEEEGTELGRNSTKCGIPVLTVDGVGTSDTLVPLPDWLYQDDNVNGKELSVVKPKRKNAIKKKPVFPLKKSELPQWVLDLDNDNDEDDGENDDMVQPSTSSTTTSPVPPRYSTFVKSCSIKNQAPQTTGTSSSPEPLLHSQVSSLQKEVEDMRDFLEEFAGEGGTQLEKDKNLKEREVHCQLAELSDDVTSVRQFLEKFASESSVDS